MLTSTSNALIASAVSKFESNSWYTARVSVCVRPRRLPANMIVAPNSPIPRAMQSASPAARPPLASGSATRKNVRTGPAPSVRDAASVFEPANEYVSFLSIAGKTSVSDEAAKTVRPDGAVAGRAAAPVANASAAKSRRR